MEPKVRGTGSALPQEHFAWGGDSHRMWLELPLWASQDSRCVLPWVDTYFKVCDVMMSVLDVEHQNGMSDTQYA